MTKENKYFYEDVEKIVELRRILAEWEHTPYRHRCGVKGLGADCIHFVARVLEELGLLKWRKNLVPDYPRDWHMHNTRELLLENLLRKVRGEILSGAPAGMLDRGEVQNGDIILSHYGQAASHAAIYYEGYLWQALDGAGVVKIHHSDRAQRRQMKYIYRITL